MNASKLSSALYCAVAISLLSGCAASVKSGGSPMLPIQATAKQNLRVNFEGNSKVQQNEDWPLLKQEWKEALHAEASAEGYRLAESQLLSLDGKDGVGIKINVSNFRYITPGARYGAGIMVGNAWVNSSADFTDLKTGQLLGTRTYDTSSSAWEGVMSAMTEEQVQAIAKQIISDIKNAKVN